MTDQTDTMIARMYQQMQARFYGKYRGLVCEVGEGDDLGYIRALVPEVYGDEVESPWAAPSAPFAGRNHGLVLLPEKDDGVWIEFEAGDISKPIWAGFWWARGEMPADAAPKVRVLATTAGHKLVLDDDAGEVRLEHASGNGIVISGSDITLKVMGKKIVIDSAAVKINDGNLVVT